MTTDPTSLAFVYSGWDGHHESLLKALTGLTTEQLRYKPTPTLRSVGENALHIADGRLDWFERMLGNEGAEVIGRIRTQRPPGALADDAANLTAWLNATWEVVETALRDWRLDDLQRTFEQPYGDKLYAVTRQWVLWRMIGHDLHHGGEISFALGAQGVSVPELGDLGGHLTMPKETG